MEEAAAYLVSIPSEARRSSPADVIIRRGTTCVTLRHFLLTHHPSASATPPLLLPPRLSDRLPRPAATTTARAARAAPRLQNRRANPTGSRHNLPIPNLRN